MKLFIPILLTFCVSAHADYFHVNVLTNGGAEADTTGLVQTAWTVIEGSPTIQKYFPTNPALNPEDWLDTNDPGPSDRGTNFFYGGDFFVSVMQQTNSIPDAYTNYIDQGRVDYQLSGWLGGYPDQYDSVVVTGELMDASFSVLTNFSIGPVFIPDLDNVKALYYRSIEGDVPVGTRYFQVTVTFILDDGVVNDGYADNLSLEFSPDTHITSFTKTNDVLYFTIDNLLTVTTNAIDYMANMKSNSWTHLSDFVATNPTLSLSTTNNTPLSNAFFRISSGL